VTLPNGPSGIVAEIEFAVQHGSLANLPQLTQDVVMAALQAEVQASAAWNRATTLIWEGLERGIPLVLAIIQAIINRLFNQVASYPGVKQALDAIEEVPQLKALVNSITGKDGGLAELGVFLSAHWADLDFLIAEIQALLAAAGKASTGDVGGAVADAETALKALVNKAVGGGGSGFPWTFPIGFGTGSGFPWSFPVAFGDVQKDINDVADAILNAPVAGQQVLNTIVQTFTGVQTDVDHGLVDLQTAVAQLAQSPPLATVQTGLQQAAGTASQVGAIITSSGQTTAAQVGGALATAGASAASAIVQLQDATQNALGGLAPATTDFGSQLAQFFGGFSGGWLGGSTAPAPSQAAIDAARAAAAAQLAHTQELAAINAQLPNFYGGSGTSGLSVQVSLSGSLPASFTQMSSIAAYSALYNVASTVTDQETVSGIWSSPITVNGGARYLFLRVNAAFTTYIYAKWWATRISAIDTFFTELGCVVAGVQTIFASYNVGTTGLTPTFLNPSANNLVTLEATAYDIQFNYPNFTTGAGQRGQSLSFTDGSHISQLGALYRNGGFGSDEASAPGTLASWALYDSGPTAGPQAQFVATQESTVSTTYTDLATTTDQVTVNIGASGLVQVFLFASMTNTANYSFVGFALSGANTDAASDTYAMQLSPPASNTLDQRGTAFLRPGLSQGATTFKMKYRVAGGTGNFANRRIAVIPL